MKIVLSEAYIFIAPPPKKPHLTESEKVFAFFFF